MFHDSEPSHLEGSLQLSLALSISLEQPVQKNTPIGIGQSFEYGVIVVHD